MKKALLGLLTLIGGHQANSQWNSNPAVNNAISTVTNSGSTGTKLSSVAASDGNGGMYVAWEDNRNSATSATDIYLQRIKNDGTLQFDSVGLVIATAAGNQTNISIAPDGQGGVILVWQDARNSGTTGDDIYGQRVTATGVMWAQNGVQITNGGGTNTTQSTPLVTAISLTEAIVTWRDSRGASSDPYANKISLSNGAPQWTADVLLSNAAGVQTNYAIVPDGANGAIIVWEDPTGTPSAGTSDRDIFGQRLDNAGNKLWSPSSAIGHSLVAVAGIQQTPQIAPDGMGGIVAVWADQRTGTNGGGDIYTQRFDATGAKVWTNDVQVVNAAGIQTNPLIVNSGNGFVIAWSDPRVAIGDRNIYAQKVDMNGALQWTPTGGAALDGIPVVTVAGHQPASSTTSGYLLLSDGTGGAFVVWDDARAPGTTTSPDMYAQKLSTTGAILWAENGTVVSNATNGQRTPAAVQDFAGGIIVAWSDSRTGAYSEIYASRVFAGGALPVEFIKVKASKNNNAVLVEWEASCDNMTDRFVIEKSKDGLKFNAIGVVKANNITSICIAKFSYDDKDVENGANYYRIKGIDKDGKFAYSSITMVSVNANRTVVMSLYPNPVKDVATIVLSNFEKSNYQVRVTDVTGKIIQASSIILHAPAQQQTINLGGLSKGTFFLNIIDEKGATLATKQFIKQ
jgi:hypothetical protein